MKKILLTLTTILCIAFCSIGFAGKSEITRFNGELLSVALIKSDGTELLLPNSQHRLDLNSNFTINAEVGEGKTLPEGNYKAIKYVFKNNFEAAGKLTLDDGTIYGSTATSNTPPTFKKNQPPEIFSYKYAEDKPEHDWGWCTTKVENGKLTVIENTDFTLNADRIKNFKVNVTLKYLWHGQWPNFDDRADITQNAEQAEQAEQYLINGDTITAPFIEAPEMENSFE